MSIKDVYMSVFRGLRRYYADREGNDSTATFSAMAALSAILMWYATSTVLIGTMILSGNSRFAASRAQERFALVALWGVVLLANWTVAVRLGLYREPLPDSPTRWVLYLRVLLGVGVLLLACLVAAATYTKK